TPLNGSSVVVDRIAIAGTRGWLCPNEAYFEAHDRKVYEREVSRLRAALGSVKDRRPAFDVLIVALREEPVNQAHDESLFGESVEGSRGDLCVYGHLQGEDIKSAFEGRVGATTYRLVSADAADFKPIEIWPGGG